MAAKAKFKRIQLTDGIWELVREQSQWLDTTESKYVNRVLADVFSKTKEPIPKGTVLP